ncbi:beta-fructofuranosidase, insoluble isoenzyme CWINV1-like isoform X2 [Diospyros lotus]|uniref:beta-fructofuranosidase, insoluble isoenzyme CWINV1-like isoform X2 n=1 Tax=Diospyros lotus TaxID=55363 RepID=UPI0022572658|nr:beta-fructofuranosidase, insoluble isoenzyme CWINV1-like isoform X2 [Diospyros lotus]
MARHSPSSLLTWLLFLLHGQFPPANQPYRTSYHFQPLQNWMNGPMIYKGIYHLFYQYNPYGAVWSANIVWAHSTSTDLINWIPHSHAIYPSQPSDINGCWSGSATILPGGEPLILYTGINQKNQEVQNLAMPKNLSDPYLVEWTKSAKNPLMAPDNTDNINASSFRDPTTAWLGPDGKWRVIIGSEIGSSGMAVLYWSKDFIQWTKAQHSLHSAEDTGMWECPDFYPVSGTGADGLDTSTIGPGVKHVLKVSLFDTKHDHYIVGTYDIVKDVFIPDKGSEEYKSWLRYDYGKYYASKTFFDGAKNRRVLWAWINESTDATIDVKKGWSGIQGIPRQIWLDRSGKQLVQWPVEEIEKLRMNQVDLPGRLLKGGSMVEVSGVTAAQADVEIEFEIPELEKADFLDPNWSDPQAICRQKGAPVRGGFGPFGLLVLASKDLQEHTSVFFRVFRHHDKNKFAVLMCSDQSRSSLLLDYDKTTFGAFVDVDPTREKLSLRSLIDHSIVESFGAGGKACISARVYPSLAVDGNAHLYAFNNGTQSVRVSKLRAWSMKKAQINYANERANY